MATSNSETPTDDASPLVAAAPKKSVVRFTSSTILDDDDNVENENNETQPLTASILTDPNKAITKLREEMIDVQKKLEKALLFQQKKSSTGILQDNNLGHVDVHFVRTKLSKTSKEYCKTKMMCCGRENNMPQSMNVKTILHNFHADFPEGCVTALMGPSGAGKTTLLDFLTGMLGDSVHASGQVALPDDDAYVPQDDRLHGFYTCQMYMEHYARLTGMKPLCCGDGSGNGLASSNKEGRSSDEETPQDPSQSLQEEENVDETIATILSEVGLSAQAHTVVGGLFKRGLSGGQKRRLSVALEALSSPLNLFLDEPTSGLDSESALALMQYLHTYARGTDPATGRRRRVIVTIHQPSSQIWEIIDNVVLLAQGRLMYQGPRKKMDDFFAVYGHPVPVQYNPADFFIEALFKMPTFDGDGDLLTSNNNEEQQPATTDNTNTSEMWSRCFKHYAAIEEETLRQSHLQSDNNIAGATKGFRRVSLMVRQRQASVLRRDPSESGFDKLEAKMKRKTKKVFRSAIELTRRSFVNLFRNPVVLGLRVAIYGGMSLVIGILFWNLDEKTDMHSVIISRTALLYFIIAFCSSMSVAVIPFAMIDRGIVQKEVRNHLYHPALYHASQTLAGIPVCVVLSILVTVIVLGMTGLKGGIQFWFILFLTFLCADATSMFVGHIAPEMISAICIASGIFGVFTMVMGFLVAPSNFPRGLGWLYYIPFMTYGFRSLMYGEYHDAQLNGTAMVSDMAPDLVNDPNFTVGGVHMSDHLDNHQDGLSNLVNLGRNDTMNGDSILKSFEMDNVDVRHDSMVLILWAVIAHAISIIYLCYENFKSRRMFVYSD